MSVSPGRLHISRASPGGSWRIFLGQRCRPADQSAAARFLSPGSSRRGILRPPGGRSPVPTVRQHQRAARCRRDRKARTIAGAPGRPI